ncbi:MAG: biosynthetic-type acetolactate synthase large subunit [Firmicutes bacterium]|nr:biosynthetic-type acetolactate synthase large subunit [Bacillota bacterium]
MKLSGAEILIQSLFREGVEVVFGYPGGAVMEIYDKLIGAPITHYLVRHEQGAVHAADGYARTTGKPGVCIATSGPGATNLVTGLATAYMDSVPVVAFTGQVATSLLGTDAFQEADITGITLPITKHNYLVKKVEDLPRVIKEAFHIATTGRPGPVLVDLPKDITQAEAEFIYPDKVELASYKPTLYGHLRQIERAVNLIQESTKPLLYVGGGAIASGATAALHKLTELVPMPVTATLMGLGAYQGTDPYFLGMLGMHGTPAANYATLETDLLIAVGARFDDRVTGNIEKFIPNAQVIHIDIDPAEIGKNVVADIPIVGDATLVLEAIVESLAKRDLSGPKAEARRKWLEQTLAWKEQFPLEYGPEESPQGVAPQFVVEELYRQTKGEAIITTEVGQNQMWAAQFYCFDRPRSLASSGGLGTMGYGLPAAIGAQIGNPGRTVIDIAGDGSFLMNVQELATAVQYGIPIKVAILNNQFLGMVRQWQEIFYQRRYSHTCLRSNPDNVKIAEAFGAVGLRATSADETREVIAEALAIKDRPVVMDFKIDREANVLPMVPPNGSLDQMIGGGTR